ncbi:MAG TPA: DUF1294 domain-containing protein [Noviherbaspirillum sp.]|jgi:uncharacterized membrane protein YsdA (DUF1294 family)|uniref:DUF1294 domain-containing protein n=1 Tax=Noviherbaspirillum sp. TaxID=1926288 RepID=UPI002F91CAF6
MSRRRQRTTAPTGVRNTVLALVTAFAAGICLLAASGRIPWLLPAYYAVLAGSGFGAYAIDKHAALRRHRRIPERRLHLLALAGAWPGAMLAQQLLRHKTRKQPFGAILHASALANCLALGLLVSHYWR